MKDLEQVTCPKCGFKNIKLTRKCTKCNYDLDKNNKICPRCGKIKANNVKRCECGFNFSRKRISVFLGLIVSLIVVVLLFILYKINPSLFNDVSFALKVILIFVIFVSLLKTYVNINAETVAYSAEKEMIEKHKKLKKMKKTSNIAVVIGFVIALLFLVYYYLLRK